MEYRFCNRRSGVPWVGGGMLGMVLSCRLGSVKIMNIFMWANQSARTKRAANVFKLQLIPQPNCPVL